MGGTVMGGHVKDLDVVVVDLDDGLVDACDLMSTS